jgi:hypothetical protein
MSEVVQFPGAEPPPEGYSESHVDKLHSEAFRDLENSLGECVSMSKIAAQLMSDANDGKQQSLCFAVLHLNGMLLRLKDEYYARWHGEIRGDR